jgi:hypothetical protein
MSLSRIYTAASFWREAVRDLGDVIDVPHWEKYNLINRSVRYVSSLFYSLMSNLYMTEVPITSSIGKYDATPASATYNATTKVVVLGSASASITSDDIGAIVTMRLTSSIYIAVLNSVVSTSSFVVSGLTLPSTNVSGFTEISISGTTVSSDEFSLSSLPIMMTGEQIKIELASTIASITVKAGTQRSIDVFRPSAQQNLKTILWALNGDKVSLTKGDSVVSYNLIVRYPRVPTDVSTDAEYIDLPDGMAIEIGIIYLKGLIKQRLTGKKEIDEGQIQRLIQQLFTEFNQTYSEQIVKEKAQQIIS